MIDERKGVTCRTYLLVASSRSKIRLGLNIALARQNSCFCPALNQSELKSASNPPLSSITALIPVFSSTVKIASSLALEPGSRLYLTVPANSSGSCGRVTRDSRSLFKFNVDVSMPSMAILPPAASYIRRIKARSVDLPLPLRPQTAIFSPGLISMFISFSTVMSKISNYLSR
jgi:hypothetical protein